MNLSLRHIPLIAGLSGLPLFAQFDASQVQFWVGSGQDSSVLVVDFKDDSSDASYAWGFLHDGATGADMLAAVAAADINFSISVGSGFLNDIIYNDHEGIGGTDGLYWSTWSGTGMDDLTMNAGIGTGLENGSFFGCSFTDFNPALVPDEPMAAFEPFRFTAADVQFWVGTGSDTALVIVDFQDGSGNASFGWGVLFNGTTTGADLLTAITAADPLFNHVTASGFLNDVTYGSYAGLGGSPDYWSTWSGTNLGNWSMNMGIGTNVSNGELFGLSYTDFSPALRPGYPVPASTPTSVVERTAHTLSVYPQPASTFMHIAGDHTPGTPISVFSLTGASMFRSRSTAPMQTIDVAAWPAGAYLLQVGDTKRIIAIH